MKRIITLASTLAATIAVSPLANPAHAQRVSAAVIMAVSEAAESADSACKLRERSIRKLWVMSPGRGGEQVKAAEELIRQAENLCLSDRDALKRGSAALPPELQRHLLLPPPTKVQQEQIDDFVSRRDNWCVTHDCSK